MTDRTIGIDEAGRGPILGPMAMAVVVLDDASAAMLQALGVSDSKEFAPGPAGRSRRADLAAEVRRAALAVADVLVSVEEIDRYTFRGQLNGLERRVARDLLMRVGARWEDRIICDGQRLFGPMRGGWGGLVAVDRAESIHVAVAAASIVAKHMRDEAFATIAARYEAEFGVLEGGGYLNEATRRFLSAYRDRYGALPPEARRSWGAPKEAANLSLFEDDG